MTIELRVIGCFGLRVDGVRVEITGVPARVLGFLALQGRPVARPQLATVLWPDAAPERAQGNLRSALWRLPHCARAAVEEDARSLNLTAQVRCDVPPVLLGTARESAQAAPALDLRDLLAGAWRDELLAGWYDDWVLDARDALQERRAVLLEDLAARSSATGRRRDALLYATLAVGSQPLRESAQRALLRAHLELGHISEAMRLYRELERMLLNELGVRPAAETVSLISSLRSGSRVEVA
jgi:DNA-binding SARP family transcriptional activator